MRITRYIHSRLLLEKDGDRLLFDPGEISSIEGLVQPKRFRGVGTVMITHDHPDHLDPNALCQILAPSNARVVTKGEVTARLAGEGIDAMTVEDVMVTAGAFSLRAIPVRPEPMLRPTLPQVTAFLVDGQVLNVSNSFVDDLKTFVGTDLLIVPVMAPFLTEFTVAAFVREMRPRNVIPVHDGYARNCFRPQRYDAFDPAFADLDLRFYRVTQPGNPVEL